MRRERRKCFYCGKENAKCKCEYIKVHYPALRTEVRRRYYNGTRSDRDMISAEQLRTILRDLDALGAKK